MLLRWLGVAAFWLSACGGATSDDDSATHATGGRNGTAGAGGTASTGWNPVTGGTGTGGQVYSTYTAQGCPDPGTASVTMYCDPFTTTSDCLSDQGCIPKKRASQDPCQPAQYYFVCDVVGTGEQSDYCTSYRDCAPGYTCVSSDNGGTQCQRTCDSSNSVDSCAPGMRCSPIDVPGVGTCS